MSDQDKVEHVVSKDGSSTLYVPHLNEHYHSTNGAIQESMHVFIKAALEQYKGDCVSILEFGFGTGLNAFLTLINAKAKVHYHSMEKYPLDSDKITLLNYGQIEEGKHQEEFNDLHHAQWQEEVKISDQFYLYKEQCDFKSVLIEQKYNLIYFDAFAPDVQPQLWTKDIFEKAYAALLPDGTLTTYCAKGVVRRTMQEVGFKVERLPGPPGKREMLRATK